ncbi:MAG: hypothetical protein VXB01_11440 [Opitutae bacterium]|jgi:hypothetical protein
MKVTYKDGGRMYQKGGTVITGQDTSTVRTEESPSGETREYVWFDQNGSESVMFDASDSDWEASGAVKVYGNWNEYAQGQTEKGEMYLPDEAFPIMQMENGTFLFDESRYEGNPSGLSKAAKMRSESTGGPSNTEVEDLLERLGAAPSPTKFNMGGILSMDSFTGVTGPDPAALKVMANAMARAGAAGLPKTGPDSTMLKVMADAMASGGAAGISKEKLWGPHEKEMTPAQKIGALSTGGPSASRVEDLLERLMSYGRYR